MRVSVVRDGDTDMGDLLQAAWLFLAVGLILLRDLGLANTLKGVRFLTHGGGGNLQMAVGTGILNHPCNLTSLSNTC